MTHLRLNENVNSGYPIGTNMDKTRDYIRQAVEQFKTLGIADGLNLWCRGSSGAILAAIFEMSVDNECRICHVKKPDEDSHNGTTFGNSHYIDIFIDDFIGKGHTFKAVHEALRTMRGGEPYFKIVIVARGFRGTFTENEAPFGIAAGVEFLISR